MEEVINIEDQTLGMLRGRDCIYIDTYENIETYGHLDYSDFNWVKNSQWLAGFPIRKDFDKSIYKHYQVFTYDFVFNIIAVSYELDYDLVHAKPFR